MEWILAPMDGITDFRFRNAWWKVFSPVSEMKRAVAPFITLVAGQTVRASHLEDVEPENNRMQIEPQILGNETAYFGPMSRALYERGYRSVNWNLGCPMRQVASKGRGSGMLPFPEKIDAFIATVLPESPLRLSVKLRLGYYDKQEIFPVLQVLNQYPLEYVAVHPRTGKQLYEGNADWDSLERVLEKLKAPCVYSGDIDSVEKAEAFMKRFPQVEKIMLGRKVISDPFFPSVLDGKRFSPGEKERMFACFVQALLSAYILSALPEKTVLQRQKLFWSRFSGDFVPCGGFERVKRAADLSEYLGICKILFGSLWLFGQETYMSCKKISN